MYLILVKPTVMRQSTLLRGDSMVESGISR